MPRPRSGAFLALPCSFLLLLVAPAPADDAFAARVDAFVKAPSYRQAHWGLLVVDAKTGKALYEHDADRLFAPASVTKLYSCAAALCALGPAFTFKTTVRRRGEVAQGRLEGDLVLVGTGDLTLGGRTDKDGRFAFKNNDHTYADGNPRYELTDTDPLAGLKALARQVKEAGIREVAGDVLVDDRLFERALGSGSGPRVLSPVVVNDNVIDLLVAPGPKVGDAAPVTVRPRTSTLRAEVHVKTVVRGPETLTWERPEPGRLIVKGQIRAGGKPRLQVIPVEEPAAFARALLIEALRNEGIAVKAGPWQKPRSALPDRVAGLPRVALFESAPLSELVRVTLKVSHNLYASTLPLLVAAHGDKPAERPTLADGMRRQRDWLARLGVDVATVSFGGGAGGSNADMTTPRATVQLLRAMAKRPEYEAYRAGLPVLGVDGTLADVVEPDSPARGKVTAKTGTLGWVDLVNDRLLLRSKALAGVMTTASGRELTFAFFVNDVPLPKGTTPLREGKALGRLCEIIYQHCP